MYINQTISARKMMSSLKITEVNIINSKYQFSVTTESG